MFKRRRFKQILSLKARLIAEAKNLREKAKAVAPGIEKEALLKKARQADVAAQMDEWLSSPGLRAPE